MTGSHGTAGGSTNRAAVSGPPAGPLRSARKRERKRVRGGALSEARKRQIIDRLKRELVHTLGYAYDYGTIYGLAYD